MLVVCCKFLNLPTCISCSTETSPKKSYSETPRLCFVKLRRNTPKVWTLTSLRVEDRLDGAANFSSWKERIVLLLHECGLWDIVEKSQTNPVMMPTNATLLEAYTKENIKTKRIILDAIKDHVIPHVTRKTNAYEMWESLTKLYQSSNEIGKWY
jgi:hypothetical protein